MEYKGHLIRPPSEANSLIFQITYGCSDNSCIFCPAYKEQKYYVRPASEIKGEIKEASTAFPGANKIFFADGDAIGVDQKILIEIFDYAMECFSKLNRISIYGSIKSIKTKTIDDLIELKNRKLGLIYIGIETGDKEVYDLIKKYGSVEEIVETFQKVKKANIKTNATIILGLGGTKYSNQHAINTAKILSEARPEQIAALTLMVVKGTPIYKMIKEGSFEEVNKFQMLQELYLIIQNMDDFKCLFFSNHASNYYPIQARFPKDKVSILKNLSIIINNESGKGLTPEWKRGL